VVPYRDLYVYETYSGHGQRKNGVDRD
jgi:hypothetical protein